MTTLSFNANMDAGGASFVAVDERYYIGKDVDRDAKNMDAAVNIVDLLSNAVGSTVKKIFTNKH